VAFGEALEPSFKDYAKQIVVNAKSLSEELLKREFKLISGGTDNHLMLADVYSSFGIDGGVVESALDKIGLTLNKNAIANDPLPPFKPSGVRLGTPAITTRGLVESDMEKIADWMTQAINNRDNDSKLASLKDEVKSFSLKFPLPSDK
jgi:glycine hydroxymethyltransferase